MRVQKLTSERIRSLPERDGRYAVRAGRGLWLRVHPGGARTWSLRCRVRRRSRNITLGRWPDLTAEQAARQAKRMRRRLEHSPEEQTSLRDFSSRYLKEIASKARKDTKPVERYLKRDVYPALGDRPIADVTAAEVQQLVFARRDAGRPASAAAIRDLLGRIFRYAKVCRLRDDNPVEATPAEFVYVAKSRERALTAAELKVFFRRLEDRRLGAVYAVMLDLLLLTLARKSELRRARWTDVDLERAVWEVPAEHSKTGKPHVVYLSGAAVERFRELGRLHAGGENPHVLPRKGSTTEPLGASGLNRAMGRVKWGIAAFTPHDLRRTASTLLNEQDYDDDWIETALNHARGGIRGVYNRARYGTQRRRMLEEWAAYLDDLR